MFTARHVPQKPFLRCGPCAPFVFSRGEKIIAWKEIHALTRRKPAGVKRLARENETVGMGGGRWEVCVLGWWGS